MKFYNTIFMTTLLASAIFVFNSHAQESFSTGRSHGTSIDVNSYYSLKRIRTKLNKGDNEDVARLANRYLKSLKSGRRTGNNSVETSSVAKEYQNLLCVSLTNLGKVEDATTACEKSIEVSPDQWESLKSRAVLKYMRNDFAGSLDDFKRSLNNAPQNDELHAVLKQNIQVVENKLKAENQ